MGKIKEKKVFVAPTLGVQKIQGEQILAGSGSVPLNGGAISEGVTEGGTVPGFSKIGSVLGMNF